MKAYSVPPRALFLSFCFGAPAAMLAAVVARPGRPALFAAEAAFAAVVLALFTAAFFAEAILRRGYAVDVELSPGLARTLACSAPGLKLCMIPRATPAVWCARSLAGSGTIFISRGLVARLTEDELRAVFRECARQGRAPGAAFRSLCAILQLGLVRATPRAWRDLVLRGRSLSRQDERRLTPISALAFAAVYPWLRLLGTLGGLEGSDAAHQGGSGAELKISRAMLLAGADAEAPFSVGM